MTAPMMLDGPMNGAAFLAYVEQALAPTLARRCRRHGQSARPQECADSCCHRGNGRDPGRRTLPDFNPIKNAFAKLKAFPHKAEARTPGKLWYAISDALTRFSAKECTNYFAAAGYEPT
jgi:hypothetical protein